MNSNRKTKTIILLIVGIFFAFSPIFIRNLMFFTRDHVMNSACEDNFDDEILKFSVASRKIHIINNSGWLDFRNDGNCTGSGTYSDPYVIEDLEIDGGGLGSCIWIENSNLYFKIENCSVYNSGEISNDAGIRLSNVTHSQLINNDCSSNGDGICLLYCDNNTISGNFVNDNSNYGISLDFCDNNNMSENTANNNLHGIELSQCYNCTLSENIMIKCSLTMSGTLKQLNSHNISTSNLVNGKPLYYYKNEVNLKPDNFMDAGQVILVNCNSSIITNLVIFSIDTAISMYYCNNNTISGNIANNNYCGLELYSCVRNIVSGNVVNYNHNYGIKLWDCHNNTILRNTADNNYIGLNLYYCDDITISGNMVYNNSYRGINLIACDNNAISENTVSNNAGYGIYFTSYEDNDIVKKAICVGNIISGNIVNDNYEGITFLNCHNDTISGNIVSNNKEWGIFLVWCYDIVVSENIANNNKKGIFLDIARKTISGYNISGNIANNNSFYGIDVYDSKYSIILENIVNHNGKAGIHVEGSDHNTISKNTINDNSRGIYLENSKYNIISGNNLIGNNECIIEENCQGNEFSNNGDCTYGQKNSVPIISGYILIFLLGVISVVSVIVSKKLKNPKS